MWRYKLRCYGDFFKMDLNGSNIEEGRNLFGIKTSLVNLFGINLFGKTSLVKTSLVKTSLVRGYFLST
jgi:uncharacterized protein YjbI with pentapeptide repeats